MVAFIYNCVHYVVFLYIHVIIFSPFHEHCGFIIALPLPYCQDFSTHKVPLSRHIFFSKSFPRKKRPARRKISSESDRYFLHYLSSGRLYVQIGVKFFYFCLLVGSGKGALQEMLQPFLRKFFPDSVSWYARTG